MTAKPDSKYSYAGETFHAARTASSARKSPEISYDLLHDVESASSSGAACDVRLAATLTSIK